MSVASILAARGREMVNTRARPLEGPRRASVEAAIETVQLEIIRLRRLQQDLARRDDREKRLRLARAEFVAESCRKAEARLALRSQMLVVDRSFFKAQMQSVVDRLKDADADALCRALNTVLEHDVGGK
jgi:hypothetical protein